MAPYSYDSICILCLIAFYIDCKFESYLLRVFTIQSGENRFIAKTLVSRDKEWELVDMEGNEWYEIKMKRYGGYERFLDAYGMGAYSVNVCGDSIEPVYGNT